MAQRLQRVLQHIQPGAAAASVVPRETAAAAAVEEIDEDEMGGDGTITVIDNRTGKKFDMKLKNGTIPAPEFFKIRAPGVPGIRLYDPALMNTVGCTSRVTYINGSKGILRYRGYPIEQLAEQSTFLEVSYLLLYGNLPTKPQLEYFSGRIMKHTFVHEDLKQLMQSFRYDAHPMGMIISAVTALSTFYPEANPALAGQEVYANLALRNKLIHRIIGTMPTIAAMAYRRRIGRPYVDPSTDDTMGYAENYLYMMDKMGQQPNFRPHPGLARALDILFILHADHEQNCSTAAMRHLTSSGVDVYTAIGGATGALYGPRHGGANEAVLRMLAEIKTVANVPAFVQAVKDKKAKLMGFGHRVYKNYDPRAKIVRKVANDVFAILGKEPLIEIATALEKVALEDPYFIERKLYPNVDFYSGLIYKAMGFPVDYFTVLFAIPRTVGWLAHWNEFLDDPENKIVRPRQTYLGHMDRNYVPLGQRPQHDVNFTSMESPFSRRLEASLANH